MSIEVSLKKQNTIGVKKEVSMTEVNEMFQRLSNQFSIDVMELAKKVATKKADGFSLNKNSPYIHLYIGNGSENVSVEVMTLENETKIKVPKSFFLD